MVNNITVATSGCCAMCGFITNNKVIWISGLIVVLITWIYSLVNIIVNCRRRNKTLKRLHERRLRREHTKPA